MLVVALIGWRWSALLIPTLSQDLAYALGINPKREQLALTFALAITVAVAIKVANVLLIAAMLIISATACHLSRTPEGMALTAGLIGVLLAVIGLRAAYMCDTLICPCIAALTFLVTSVFKTFRQQSKSCISQPLLFPL